MIKVFATGQKAVSYLLLLLTFALIAIMAAAHIAGHGVGEAIASVAVWLLMGSIGSILVWVLVANLTSTTFFGAKIDTWTLIHLFGPALAYYLLQLILPQFGAAITVLVCVIAWEIWDRFKLTSLPEDSVGWSNFKVTIYKAVFISDGYFDVADAVAGFCGLAVAYAWSL